VVTGDAKALAKAPGIGPKTAQRMVLELKDSVKQEDLTGESAPVADAQSGPAQEAILALMALGYTSAEAAGAVSAVRDRADKPDQIVLLALRRLGGA
jgi:Holliday junction DNA helicase RuvA